RPTWTVGPRVSGARSASRQWVSWQKHRLTLRFRGAREVHKAVNAPERHHAEGDERLLGTHARNGERTDDVKQHAHQVGQQPKHRNDHVLESVEHLMLL